MSTNTNSWISNDSISTRLREATYQIARQGLFPTLEEIREAISPATLTQYALWLREGFEEASHPAAMVNGGTRWRVMSILVGSLERGLQESDRRIAEAQRTLEGY